MCHTVKFKQSLCCLSPVQSLTRTTFSTVAVLPTLLKMTETSVYIIICIIYIICKGTSNTFSSATECVCVYLSEYKHKDAHTHTNAESTNFQLQRVWCVHIVSLLSLPSLPQMGASIRNVAMTLNVCTIC